MATASVQPLLVRPLRDGEERLFHSIAGDPATLDARADRLAAYRAANPGLPPACHLLAFRGERAVGRLSGMISDATAFVLQQLDAATDDSCGGQRAGTPIDPASADNPSASEPEIVAALFDGLRRLLAGWTFEAVTWRRTDDEPLHRRLLALGFAVRLDKAFYRRPLPAANLCPADPLAYRSLTDLGRDAFLAIYRSVYANLVDRDFGDPDGDFASHIAFAGPAFAPDRWLIGSLGDQPVGYVLPQVYPDVPTEGSLFSLGLVPAFRGRGLGRILHARGLAELAAAGATRYAGSTDVRNDAMVKVFLANGCREVGTRRIYRWTARA